MVVLQFGFNPRQPKGGNRPSNHTEDRIVYTGTQDHDTARGWYESLPRRPREMVDAELAARGIAEREPWWALIRLAYSSPARVAIVQAQDVLGWERGADERPWAAVGDWRWQLEPRALKPALARGCGRRPRRRAGSAAAKPEVKYQPVDPRPLYPAVDQPVDFRRAKYPASAAARAALSHSFAERYAYVASPRSRSDQSIS